MKTVNEAFRATISLLRHLPQPALDARLLLQKAASLSEEQFFVSPDKLLSPKEEQLYERLIAKRLARFPLSYLTGVKEFWSMSFRVKRGVFIPRPETELLVERVLELCEKKNPLIMDVGTGCGNIALALAKELPRARIVAADISLRSLKIARQNASRLGVMGVIFVQFDLLEDLKKNYFRKNFDFIVSNPPYVSATDWPKLIPEIRFHEPKRALVPGKTGLEFIRRLIWRSADFLKPDGWLVFEIGYGQLHQVLDIYKERQIAACRKDALWKEINFANDISGTPRLISARRA